MSTDSPRPDEWDLAGVLSESTRRRVFDLVRAAAAPLTRDEVAARAGINRRLAVFHLDRLVTAGLLVVDFARPAGNRGGPGSGRPSKRYAPADIQLDVSLPPRHYDVVARVLTAGITTRPHDAQTGVLEQAHAVGYETGERRQVPAGATISQRTAAMCDSLSTVGYEPSRAEDEPNTITLTNCPFRKVADLNPSLICGMNESFVNGLLDGTNARPANIIFEPNPPCCCVTILIS